MKFKKKISCGCMLMICSVFLSVQSGCTKGDIEAEEKNTGAVIGLVEGLDSNAGIGKVDVYAGQLSAATNENGWFSITKIPDTAEIIASLSKSGYLPLYKSFEIRVGITSYVFFDMMTYARFFFFQADTGDTLSGGDFSVDIPGSALHLSPDQTAETDTPCQGTVSSYLYSWDPTNEDAEKSFPGDYQGLLEGDDTPVYFTPYGFFHVKIHDENENALYLGRDATARISIGIPEALQENAPSVITRWYFNKDTCRWQASGTFQKNAEGVAYTSDVRDLSVYWCAALPYECAYISGRIVDCDDEPLKGARVSISGADESAPWQNLFKVTPVDGTFLVPVKPDTTASLCISSYAADDEVIEIFTPSVGATMDIGKKNFCSTYPLVSVAVEWGETPRDLDLHLSIPPFEDDGDRIHLSYQNQDTGEAVLEQESVKGYGPEVATVYNLRDGKYRFSVHHYAGVGNISNSGALATLTIKEKSGTTEIYSQNAPAGGEGVNDLWLLWEIEVKNGSISDVSSDNDETYHVITRDMDEIHPSWYSN